MHLQATHEVGQAHAAISLDKAPLLQLSYHKLFLRFSQLFCDQVTGYELWHLINLFHIYMAGEIREYMVKLTFVQYFYVAVFCFLFKLANHSLLCGSSNAKLALSLNCVFDLLNS